MSQLLEFGLTVLASSLAVTALLALFMHSLIKMGSGRVLHSTSETAETASDVYGTAADRVSEAYDTAAGKVSSAYGTARERVAAGAESVAEVAARQKEQIAAAIEAGRQAYREEKRKAGAAGEAED